MRIILVGGGTSGHINPALNIAEYIKSQDKNCEILYVGSKNGMEVELVKKAGLKFRGITVSGFSRKINLESAKKNILAIKNIILSSFESRKILKEFNPDICIGTGGYVMGAFLYQAHMMKIPFAIQEQNAIPGFTTKVLSKYAKMIFLGNEDARHYVKNENCIFTGNPIKTNFANISKEEARKHLGIDNDMPVILSFGGSLGSKAINDVMLKIIKKKKYNHIHSYGKNNKNFKEKANDLENPNIREYIHNMNECMIACDVVICRSGAMTLSELSTLDKPAILIPSPNVANNHQLYNAISYSKKFTSSVIEEKDLTEEKLEEEIDKMLKINTNTKEENRSCENIYMKIKI